jgi:hypothetical protein
MNHREPTSVPKGPGPTFPCLALLLLPLLSGVSAFARPLLPPQAGLTQQKPYLVALGAPPLRFQVPVPATELATRPKPSASRSSTADASANDIETTLAPRAEEPSSPSDADPIAHEDAASESSQSEISTLPPARTPRPILPDEMRPQARPEDFLPFFQIPAAQSGDVSVFVPVPHAPATPPPLPLSSATYTQTPR